MEDAQIIRRIGELVDREHHLENEHGHRALNDEERGELRELEVQLDRCWDLLRQRQAKREFGQNPDEAEERGPGVVESYQQ